MAFGDGSSDGTMVSLTAANGSRCFGVALVFNESGLTTLRTEVSRFRGCGGFSLGEAAFLSSSLEFLSDFLLVSFLRMKVLRFKVGRVPCITRWWYECHSFDPLIIAVVPGW